MDEIMNTTCGYCSTGCNLRVELIDGLVKSVRANPEYSVNRGTACPKGFQFLAHLDAPDRAKVPYLRNENGKLEETDWDTALNTFTKKFKNIQENYGKDSVAFLSTGQMTNEEFFYLGALTKFGMGIIHGDGNTRTCMATAVVAYKQSFGFDSPPFTYKDFEESDVMLFFGSNPLIAHPVMWNHVRWNKNEPVIFVIDPRKTKTASYKDVIHYPIKPETDIILLYGLANILIKNDWIDENYIANHTSGFEEFKNHVSTFEIDKVSEDTGLSQEEILRLAESIHLGKKVSFWWMVGINQGYEGVRTAQAIINLALMTGNIGRPGTGPNSITGQCNAMGARLFSNTTSLFCGYDFAMPEHRTKIANILKINEDMIPEVPSLPYHKILEKIDNDEIKGLWVINTNPIHSWIDRNHLVKTFDKLDFLVVQDMFYTTETAQIADLILPAGGCGEKNGTFINSERRFGLVIEVCKPPGDALPDFEIFKKVAEYWGCGDLLSSWSTPQDAFEALRALSTDMVCDFTGIKNYEMIENVGGIQWPFPIGAEIQDKERRLFEDGNYHHKDGKAKFIFGDIEKLSEIPDKDFPFLLNTGRGTVSQWHTLTRTDKAPALKRMSPAEPYIEINSKDAGLLDISDNSMVLVSSRQGSVKLMAKVVDSVQSGQVFIPMHFSKVNSLTPPVFDPYSAQPSFKYAAVKIELAE